MGRKEKRRLNRLINRIHSDDAPAAEVIRLQRDGFTYGEKSEGMCLAVGKDLPVAEVQAVKEEFAQTVGEILDSCEQVMRDAVKEGVSSPMHLPLLCTDKKMHLLSQLRKLSVLDSSFELRSILLRRTRHFLDKVVASLRTLSEERRKTLICDANQFVKMVGKELDLSTRILFEKDSPNAGTYERFIAAEFKRKISPDTVASANLGECKPAVPSPDKRSLEDLLSEINQESMDPPKKPTKKKQPKPKDDVAPEDRELEDFRTKLESLKCAKVRVKPRIGADWMTHLNLQLSLHRATAANE